MTSYDNLLGQTLHGRYRIERYIGGGGQALVFSGTDKDTGWKRAVKLLAASFNTPDEAIKRFNHESLLLANLPEHPNIVRVFDGGYDPELRAFYIVMELVEGVTLGQLFDAGGAIVEIREETVVRSNDITSDNEFDDESTTVHPVETAHDARLPIPVTVSIVSQVACALHHAHQYNIVHRDVKPSNILLGRDGRVKLTDFGIARGFVDVSLTRTGTAIGTLHYMSPEQVQDLDLDKRSDLYSLGTVLYEGLTGVTPFAEAGKGFVTFHIVNTDPPSLRQINPTIPESLEEIVVKTLKKSPDDRFQSTDEFELALANLIKKITIGDIQDGELSNLVKQIIGEEAEKKVDPAIALIHNDSGLRCPECGTILPREIEITFDMCPGCFQKLSQKTIRTDERVSQLIAGARVDMGLEIGQRDDFGLRKYIYGKYLQKPLFDEWKSLTYAGCMALAAGAVVMPPTDLVIDDKLLHMAKALNRTGDFHTDEKLSDYNPRLAERYESEALAAHSRAIAHQLIGRYHTVKGATATVAEAATRWYERANENFKQAVIYYTWALNRWENYRQGERYERIDGYYDEVKKQARNHLNWSKADGLLSQGISDFPRNREEAYATFSASTRLLKDSGDLPGVASDLQVAEAYDGYYERATQDLKTHREAIEVVYPEAAAIISQAYQEDHIKLRQDHHLVREWLPKRRAIVTKYRNMGINLPRLRRRIRLLVPILAYIPILIIWFAHLSALHRLVSQPSTVDNTRFWVMWPSMLQRVLGYSFSLGSWHQAFIMLLGLDLFIIWPINAVVKQKRHQFGWKNNLNPLIPAPSIFLLPFIDGLRAISYITKEPGLWAFVKDLSALVARLLIVVSPWIPLMYLIAILSLDSGNAAWDETSWWWWLILAIIPPASGYYFGGKLREYDAQLETLRLDARTSLEELDDATMAERTKVKHARKELEITVRAQFGWVNQIYAENRRAIDDILQVLLARMLHYKEAGEYVDLPGLENQLDSWRIEMDLQYLGWMGLNQQKGQVNLIRKQVWKLDRQVNVLKLPSTGLVLEIQFPQPGNLVCGVDGCQLTKSLPLIRHSPSKYHTEFYIKRGIKQVTLLFQAASGNWIDQYYTIWFEKA